MRAVMKNAGILAISLLIGSTAFGQALRVRTEGKVEKPGARVPSKLEISKTTEALKAMKNNPVAVGNSVSTSYNDKVGSALGNQAKTLEVKQGVNKEEASEAIALAAGNSKAHHIISSYRGLAEASASQEGAAKLSLLAQDAIGWNTCAACQVGLINTFSEATTIAKGGNYTVKTAFERALEVKNKLKEFEKNCPAYR